MEDQEMEPVRIRISFAATVSVGSIRDDAIRKTGEGE